MFPEGRELLRTWREENLRRSEEVVEIWEALLSDEAPSTLGDERWMILEQVNKQNEPLEIDEM